MLTIFVDADACPVKGEVYRVAKRFGLEVRVVANSHLRTPASPLIEAVVVGGGPDAADDWIVERAGAGDIVVTADIPLAARCLENGARVLGLRGRELSESSIGNALSARNLADHLREIGVETGGPPPLAKKDRSRFLSRLDEMIHAIRREVGSPT